jgi:hypothetical protein
MINRDIYTQDPSTRKLINEGVANVNYEHTRQALEVLRYELETFVCEGQYAKGLQHILDSYLKDITRAQQQAVWVSGFYGSGKSHLVKILRALWVNTKFEDGATARGIANLPQNIHDLLRELSIQAKRFGGLHAASGTLGAAASGSVRLALLRIVFQSCGLPEQYPVARFVIWLKKEGIYAAVRHRVEQNGFNWQEELDNFYVAEGLHEALVHVKPNLFLSTGTCVETLNNLYPYVQDVSNEEMIKTIRLTLTRDNKFPLTLIVLDEVQQFIGESSERSMDVQEMVEACCKNIGGKLLFIGTGQTAVTGTTNLKKLAGRFTRRIELSDTDVEAVIRQVILAKKPEAFAPIEQVMQNNLGEISRHLSGTTIAHHLDDINYFAQDYPILPVRRRFWESTLRVLDPTGTESQLRNQLSMIHKAIQTNPDNSLGHVIPADYLYFDSADRLLQSRILSRNVHEKTMRWINGTEEEQLKARACGLVFLINKLAGSNNEVGIKSTVDALADLMVENLSAGSSTLRSKLPALLDKCELLIKVGDEYRIQTKESAAWNDEFLNQRSQLANQHHHVDAEREERMRRLFATRMKNFTLNQGSALVAREFHPCFDSQLPADSDQKVYIWVRNGWAIDENSVRVDARQAGNVSPTVFVFLPKRSADDLRHYIIDYKAADTTLKSRGIPNTPEGQEASAAMETTRQLSEGKIMELLDEIFSSARVFQGGGNEITGNDLSETVREAAGNALQRLYNQFNIADHPGWGKVYSRAKQGAPDALKAAGFAGKPAHNPVCKAILGFIAGGKKGAEIRSRFESPPYGWSRDAVDGALQVLLNVGLIHVRDERGQTVKPQNLERKAMGKAMFKVESATVTTQQRIQIRKLLQKMDCQAKQGDELAAVPQFLQKMQKLAERAGGEAPQPERPDTSTLEEIRLIGGNEQLLALYNRREELFHALEKWSSLAEQIATRWPPWEALEQLLHHAGKMDVAEETRKQAEAVKKRRLLLSEPDPIQPLAKSLENALRAKLTALQQKYTEEFDRLTAELESDPNWENLDERSFILEQCGINQESTAALELGTCDDLLQTLARHPLNIWEDRIGALEGRFFRARELAARALEPETQTVSIPRRTLKTEEEIAAWIKEVKEQLQEALDKGPVIIQ